MISCLNSLACQNSMIEERLDLTPANMRIFKIFFALGTCMHLYSCAYWRIKIETFSSDDIDTFLSSRNADDDVGFPKLSFHSL